MIFKIWFTSLLISFSTAYGFDYFGDPIDYWEAPVKARKVEKKEKKEDPPKVANPPQEKFDWAKHMDPKNDEFFKEGDYIPPAPFMELARDPSDENIKRWFTMIETKNKMMDRLHMSMAAYAKNHEGRLQPEEKALIAENTHSIAPKQIDVKRFRFRMYFDSTCPHCKNMMATMKDLQDLGYYGEVKQIDRKRPDFPIPFPVGLASPEELKAREITSWPVLFIADTAKKLVYRVNGYQSTQEILNILSSK